MITPTIRFEGRELDRYLAKLEKNRGRPLEQRWERVTRAAMRLMVLTGRREAPLGRETRTIRGETVRPGILRRKIKVSRLRQRSGEEVHPFWFGSTAFYAHMVPGGTRGHSLMPRPGKSELVSFGSGQLRPLTAFPEIAAKPDPWVDRVWEQTKRPVIDLIARDTFAVR